MTRNDNERELVEALATEQAMVFALQDFIREQRLYGEFLVWHEKREALTGNRIRD